MSSLIKDGWITSGLSRKGSFRKTTGINKGFSPVDSEFVSISILDVVGTEEFQAKMKVSQIEDGIEIGITKLIDKKETAVWYFLNKEEIDILSGFFKSIMPGINELHEENSGVK